jgi:adenylylsulfate kinase
MIIWLVGLSAAGKTTVGRELYQQIKEQRNDVLFLDGDHIRRVWGDELGHEPADRNKNAWRFCRLGQLLDEQGLHAVCCILSVFEKHRQWNRENLSSYFEVYLDVPMETLKNRDPKGLYEQAENGEMDNVVGVDIEFEEPEQPDLVVQNDDSSVAPETVAQQIIDELPDDANFP